MNQMGQKNQIKISGSNKNDTNIQNKMYYLKLPILLLLLIPIISSYVHADTPTEDELQELEQLINQQEVEQQREKQHAEEEARRKAEEQKLREERTKFEEERRKLEEQKQTELIRKQEEDETKKRLEEEQKRVAAEAEQLKQFNQYMSDAVTAINNKDYKSASQAYSSALEIMPHDPMAQDGYTKATEYQEFCNSLLGEWNWFLAKLIVHENGTMQALALIPNQGKWECSNPEKREFILYWEVGGWVDTLTMSADGNRVDVINNIGIRFQGTRYDSEAAKSKTDIKL